MLGFFFYTKRRLARELESYVAVIQICAWKKLSHSFEAQFGDESGRRLATAVVNKLFGRSPTIHTESELALAQQLASDVVRNDEEMRNAAVMALRTTMIVEAYKKDSEAVVRGLDTLHWMSQFIELPEDEPDPKLIEHLAKSLLKKYGQGERLV